MPRRKVTEPDPKPAPPRRRKSTDQKPGDEPEGADAVAPADEPAPFPEPEPTPGRDSALAVMSAAMTEADTGRLCLPGDAIARKFLPHAEKALDELGAFGYEITHPLGIVVRDSRVKTTAQAFDEIKDELRQVITQADHLISELTDLAARS